MSGHGLVCVFAKWPEPGNVKTRLARVIGERGAAALARAFLADTVATLTASGADFIVALDHVPAGQRLVARERIVEQGDGSLGDRLERVLGAALSDRRWVIALGTDSPGLPARYWLRGAEQLSDREGPDAVLGPALDGGYYLFGVRHLSPGLLHGVGWSSPHTLADTERNLAERGYRIGRTPRWFDVDDVADLRRLQRLLRRRCIAAHHTERVLDRLASEA